jgi:hypothetical protein
VVGKICGQVGPTPARRLSLLRAHEGAVRGDPGVRDDFDGYGQAESSPLKSGELSGRRAKLPFVMTDPKTTVGKGVFQGAYSMPIHSFG